MVRGSLWRKARPAWRRGGEHTTRTTIERRGGTGAAGERAGGRVGGESVQSGSKDHLGSCCYPLVMALVIAGTQHFGRSAALDKQQQKANGRIALTTAGPVGWQPSRHATGLLREIAARGPQAARDPRLRPADEPGHAFRSVATADVSPNTPTPICICSRKKLPPLYYLCIADYRFPH